MAPEGWCFCLLDWCKPRGYNSKYWPQKQNKVVPMAFVSLRYSYLEISTFFYVLSPTLTFPWASSCIPLGQAPGAPRPVPARVTPCPGLAFVKLNHKTTYRTPAGHVMVRLLAPATQHFPGAPVGTGLLWKPISTVFCFETVNRNDFSSKITVIVFYEFEI